MFLDYRNIWRSVIIFLSMSSFTQVLNDVNVYTADLNTKKSVCLYKRDNRKTNQARCKY